MDERTTLIEGAHALGIRLGDDEAQRLLQLLDELLHWNRAYNLTAITARPQMLTHHLLDSLSVAPFLRGVTVADVGSGAGFPGLPLALVLPALRFTLIDSNGKKQRFVAHATRILGLANVQLAHARAQDLRPPAPFDTVVARAFAPLPQMLASVAPLCGPGTRVLAMKGRRPDEEIAAVSAPWHIEETLVLGVPGLKEARHLVVAACKLPA